MISESDEEMKPELNEDTKDIKSLSREILVDFNRSHFEEIYYEGKTRESYSRKLKYRIAIFSSISLLFLTILIYIFGRFTGFEFIPAVFIFYVYMMLLYIKQIRHMIKWRYSIDNFLDRLSKFQSIKYLLSENGLTEITDDIEVFNKWTEFKEVHIKPDYITLQGKTSLLISRKTITEDSFEYIKSKINEKIKNGL